MSTVWLGFRCPPLSPSCCFMGTGEWIMTGSSRATDFLKIVTCFWSGRGAGTPPGALRRNLTELMKTGRRTLAWRLLLKHGRTLCTLLIDQMYAFCYRSSISFHRRTAQCIRHFSPQEKSQSVGAVIGVQRMRTRSWYNVISFIGNARGWIWRPRMGLCNILSPRSSCFPPEAAFKNRGA